MKTLCTLYIHSIYSKIQTWFISSSTFLYWHNKWYPCLCKLEPFIPYILIPFIQKNKPGLYQIRHSYIG